MRQCCPEWAAHRRSCIAIHRLNLFVAFADPVDVPAALPGVVAGVGVLVVAGGAVVFAFAAGSFKNEEIVIEGRR